MGDARNMQVSDKVRAQCVRVMRLIDGAEQIVRHRHLVPEARQHLEAYMQLGKDLPPDYCHWVLTHGSGIIDLPGGEIEIPSARDLTEHTEDGRMNGPDDPWGSHRRPWLGYAGAPAVRCIDTTITTEDGCAPVIPDRGV